MPTSEPSEAYLDASVTQNDASAGAASRRSQRLIALETLRRQCDAAAAVERDGAALLVESGEVETDAFTDMLLTSALLADQEEDLAPNEDIRDMPIEAKLRYALQQTTPAPLAGTADEDTEWLNWDRAPKPPAASPTIAEQIGPYTVTLRIRFEDLKPKDKKFA